jgi:hypothetical protein
MVFVPGLNIKGKEGWERLAGTPEKSRRTNTSEQSHDCLPTHSQVLRGSKYQDFERCVHSINAMVEKLPEGSALVRSTSAITILASADFKC